MLVDGGLIMLDDYFNEAWPGVSEGANRFLSGPSGLVGVGSAHGKTFLTRGESHAARYRDAMQRIGEAQDWSVSVQPFFGSPHVILLKRSLQAQWRRRAERAAAQLRHRLQSRPSTT